MNSEMIWTRIKRKDKLSDLEKPNYWITVKSCYPTGKRNFFKIRIGHRQYKIFYQQAVRNTGM